MDATAPRVETKPVVDGNLIVQREVCVTADHPRGVWRIARTPGFFARWNLRLSASFGSLAPQWWQQGRVAEVLNYCQRDVLLTKALFETLCASGGRLKRTHDEITIRYIDVLDDDVSWAVPGRMF